MEWSRNLLVGLNSEFATIAEHRILVIEDDRCLQNALIRLLRDIYPGVHVDWVTTADEVYANLDQTPLDNIYTLVIADIILPGRLSGLDFWMECQKRFPGIPFIITSGMGITEFCNLTKKQSPPPFLSKPFTLQECRETIQGVLKAA